MRKLVTKDDLPKVIENLNELDVLVFDVETTGINPFQSALMFSMAIADLQGNSWYFNFLHTDEVPSEFHLSFQEVKPLMDRKRLWIAHNAKFDMHFCDKAGICPEGRVADTVTLARLFENHHNGQRPYSLENCAKRWLDVKKDDRVKVWMDENYAYTQSPWGKNYLFFLVPFEIISEYAMIDAEVTARLYQFLKDNAYETSMWETEIDLTRVLFQMERRGMAIDRDYVHKASKIDETKRDDAAVKIMQVTSDDWMDSAKCLGPYLKHRGLELPQTETGKDQISDKVLRQKPDDELVQAILEYREAQKRLETYWANYRDLIDSDGVIHPDINQAGTVTGRMSCRNPNLQNIPSRKDEFSDYPIRRAFKARDGHTLVSIDYKAVEFRLALEYAGETEVIEKIKNGEDPHQATADQTGLTRGAAKTLNFAILYGAGAQSLSGQLGCTNSEAEAVKQKYFVGMPKLASFLKSAKMRMGSRRQVQNAYGRRYNYETFLVQGQPRNNAYKAANLIVQGTAADVMKRAMVSCDRLLKQRLQSSMLMTIHDELIFEVHHEEFDLIPALAKIMADAYEHKYLPLECSIEVGPNLHDMQPYEQPSA